MIVHTGGSGGEGAFDGGDQDHLQALQCLARFADGSGK